jgi:RNA methyltransferase, TrmH family
MSFKHITSRDNPVFKHLKKVSENARERRQTSLTLLEGVHLIEAYRQVFGEPDVLIIPEGKSSPEATALIQQLQDVDTIMLPTLFFAELAPVASSVGVMALVSIQLLAAPAKLDNALMLVEIQDPGNLGSMLRTAVAAGVQTVYLTKGCTDAWSPKALRGGQGAQFLLPIIEQADGAEVINAFEGSTYAMTMHGESLYAQPLNGATLFMMGNEGAGLPPALIRLATKEIAIPMAQTNAAIESLNVGAAAAVCLFECRRQKLSL